MFGAVNDTKQTTVEDGDDDLLGGGDFTASTNQQSGSYDDFDTFESSFPAVDTTNAVSKILRRLRYTSNTGF